MDETDWLAQGFQEHRAHLWTVAYRILGTPWEADDALQETWLRLSRSDASGVANLRAWLTTIVARVSLNMLSSRRSRREEPVGAGLAPAVIGAEDQTDPEHQVLLADSVGLALLVVLDTLAPAERLAFVLHDMFDVPFDEISAIIERSPVAARQLASRARRRVRGAAVAVCVDPHRQRDIVAAFLAASRRGDFQALLALLNPDVTLRADHTAVAMGASQEVRGAASVAEPFIGRYRGTRLAVINGFCGAVWAPGGRPRVAFTFTIARGRVTAVEIVGDADRLRELDVAICDE